MQNILRNLVKDLQQYVSLNHKMLDDAKDVLALFDKKIDLLDHGHLRLVDYMGTDLSISRNARVSYNADWRAGEDKNSDTKLINYLYANGHNTPFESITFTFDVKAPIFVLRQWMRHRTWSYNELSARYKELPQEFYVPDARLVGAQAKGNKQCRDVMTEEEYQALFDDEKINIEIMCNEINVHGCTAFDIYQEMLRNGMPRELARTILPVGTYSHMFATVNLNNLFKFLGERMHTHAQYEIRVYANAILELIEPIVPVAVSAFKKSLGEGYDI